MKDKLIALAYDELGNCKEILKVKNVDDQEFKKLVSEKNAHREKALQLEQSKEKELLELKNTCSTNTYLLAKSIYDNFVDRGLLDDSQEFQQMFYDFIFGDKTFELDKCPQEYLTILEKIRGLSL